MENIKFKYLEKIKLAYDNGTTAKFKFLDLIRLNNESYIVLLPNRGKGDVVHIYRLDNMESKSTLRYLPVENKEIESQILNIYNNGNNNFLKKRGTKMNNEEKEHQEEIEKLETEKEKYSKQMKRLAKLRILGWIILIIGFIFVPKNFGYIVAFMLLALYNSVLPSDARAKYNNIVEEINQKNYQYEHSPEKEKEREKQKLQIRIERATPFKSVEEKGDYHISSVSWDLTENEDKLTGVNVVLISETKYMKNLYFKYKGKGKVINAPVGMIEEEYLEISRTKMYMLVEEKKYEESENLFREVFEKDPFTGEDIVSNKI